MFKMEGYFIYLLVMAAVTYLIRVLPILFVRKKIQNVFIRSFLHYVPFVVLATIALPAILFSTGNLISGVVATLTCIVLAYLNKGLIVVRIGGVTAALLVELILLLI